MFPMYTFLMVTSLVAGILLLQIAPQASVVMWAITYATGMKAKADDEAIFMGIIFSLAIAGLAATFIYGAATYLIG